MRESQIRKLKAIGIGMALLPAETLLALFGAFVLFPFSIISFFVLPGTIIYLIGYAMVPEKPAAPKD